MALYAIGDLHLCLGAPKPMDIFGGAWVGYMEKLREGLSIIGPEDTTVLLGDLSWALDLEGAKDGGTPNLETIKNIVEQGGLLVEVGGGIRSEEVIRKYLDAGVFRVILGTAAVQNPAFLEEMVQKYGEKIAVGVDIKDGMVAIKGWTEVSQESCFDFC